MSRITESVPGTRPQGSRRPQWTPHNNPVSACALTLEQVPRRRPPFGELHAAVNRRVRVPHKAPRTALTDPANGTSAVPPKGVQLCDRGLE